MDESEITEIIDSDSNDVEIIEDQGDNGLPKHVETIEKNGEDEDDDDDDDDEMVLAVSSDSEPECECITWDDDCVVIHTQPRKNAITGYHLMPTCPLEHEVPPLKKQKLVETPTLSDNLTKEDFIELFKQKWVADEDIKTKTVDLFTHPFKFCIVDDFLEDKIILDKIREEFNELELFKRSLDLYEFFQSLDLAELKSKYITNLYIFLKSVIKDWLQNLTGLELYKMSSTCSCYCDTDNLLIHDDLRGDRIIAFVLYLTDPVPGSSEELWKKEMGGLLQLFSKDEDGHPLVPVREILPKNNSFIFFEVTNASYHQVSEVLSMDHSRLSINGWFHTLKPKSYSIPMIEPPKTGLFGCKRLPPLDVDFPVKNWINPQYLESNEIKKQIQDQIENTSEISLNDFFKKDKYLELCEVLKNDDIIWEKVGPINSRNYEILSTKFIPGIVTEVLNLFKSKNFLNLLYEFTELDFNIDVKPDAKPTLRLELQRWKPGSYSLLTEYDWQSEKELDLIMYLGNSEDSRIVGGQTMYVAEDEQIEDALVTLQPKLNSLNMVFRDTARIVKHVSKRSSDEYFYMIVCSYKE